MSQNMYSTFAFVKNKQKERINEKQKGFILTLFAAMSTHGLQQTKSRK